MSYSVQAILLAVVPKFPAALSVLCSTAIAQRIIRSPKANRLLYHRIILGLSISDILASTIYFLGTILIPKGTVGQYGPVFMAAGNTGTCSYSGFFTQFAISSPLYNGTLCLYYLLSIRFHWPEKKLVKIEWFIHGLPITFAFGTAITGVALQLYGSVEWLCWINPDPPQPDRPIWLYRWGFLFIPLWTTVVFVSVVMGILWWTVRQLEKANDRYQFGGEHQAKRTQSKKTAAQGMMYIAAFYITWFFPSLQRILELALNKNFFALQMLDTALLPLQGVFNFIVYIRPRFTRERKRYPNLGFWKVLWTAIMPPDGGNDSRVRLNSNGSIKFGSLVCRRSMFGTSRANHHRSSFVISQTSHTDPDYSGNLQADDGDFDSSDLKATPVDVEDAVAPETGDGDPLANGVAQVEDAP